MNASEFDREVVEQTLAEFAADPLNLRLAYLSILVVDCLAAYVYNEVGSGNSDDTAFRECMAAKYPSFRIVRDLAKALKHVELGRGKPLVESADQLRLEEMRYGQGGYGEGPYGGGEQVVVQFKDGSKRNVASLLRQSREAIKNELSKP